MEARLGLVGLCENRLAAVRVETETALAWRDGEAKAADAARTKLKQSRHGAKRDVKLAGQLAEVPATSAAPAGGTITSQHARLIAETAEQCPIDEAELLAAAEREPADLFGQTVRSHINARSDGTPLAPRSWCDSRATRTSCRRCSTGSASRSG